MERIIKYLCRNRFVVLSKRQKLPECANARIFDYSDNNSIHGGKIDVKMYLYKTK